MTAITLYFQVHQPFRLRRYSFLDIGKDHRYFDDSENARIVRRVARKCYLPMNEMLLGLIEETEGKFRCAYSISGTALTQFELWSPETLESFQRLAATGSVEFLAETSHHSLAFLSDQDEFRAQVKDHRDRIERLFGQAPTAFRNTELVFDNDVAKTVEELGFVALLGEGADQLLGWRSSQRLYRAKGTKSTKLLLRSYELSDDIAFRFSNQAWSEWPLRADTFANWLAHLPEDAEHVGLFMDYETAGEHQWAETGIFDFMEHMPRETLKFPRFEFLTPSEVAMRYDAVAELDAPEPISWADAERDLTAWLGNAMQRSANDALYAMLPDVKAAAVGGRPDILETWRRLSTSDHVYYMCTKFASDGDVHEYFSPYATPHDAFITFMNVVDDLGRRAKQLARETAESESIGEPGSPDATRVAELAADETAAPQEIPA